MNAIKHEDHVLRNAEKHAVLSPETLITELYKMHQNIRDRAKEYYGIGTVRLAETTTQDHSIGQTAFDFINNTPATDTEFVYPTANTTTAPSTPLDVLREFVEDVRAIGGEETANEWPDLYATYEKAVLSIVRAETVEGDSISIKWSTDDVGMRAEQNGHTLTHDEQLQALQALERHHDCNYGITWNHLDSEIDAVLADR